MLVTVKSRSGKDVVKGGLELPDEATVDDLKKAIYRHTGKYYPSRQRLTLPIPIGQERPTVLDSGKKLKDLFEKSSGGEVVFKDLGPQIAYSTLFFLEYIGPLVIFPIFYYLPVYSLFSLPQRKIRHPAQTYALWYWTLHYSKRIFETYFVHTFSHATSPISNAYRNCLYYWSFAAGIAYFVNHPLYTPVSEIQMYIGFISGLIWQLSNLYCHIILKNLRSQSKGGYQIPRGFLFNYITCANYTTEVYQWLGFNIATQTVAGYTFVLFAAYIMTNWALPKHRRLKKLFDGKEGRAKYPKRWVIFPPFI
ncbi:hypothetical protein O6H91_02G064500 [Diphasiastrum complanatum]|uniref:Uncharacterized protein n=1 Tax=Diphasiastrum complanatum TaxID=34168 RepID=A0ACC2EGE4_DIPCM|nr:hypothetical protein O6H91_02G064500 [Diphasiastrum complanatum]